MKQVLRDALDARGYTTLTPVQTAVLAPELEGRDMLVSAQTGSGKTVGFGLAIAPKLLPETDTFGPAGAPLALVIAPTRELAMQVKRELGWLYEKAGAVLTSCVGGMDMRDERRALARGAHIVAATPGRLRDHIMRGSIDLTQIRAIVLDEADEMLDLGFREDLEFILGEAPEDRQTLLFSATVPGLIARLAETYQNDAERVIAKSATPQHADIRYMAMNVADRDTENAVINTLLFHDAPNAIVFANTRAMVNRITTRLSNRGFKVVALSGELSQAERTHALQAMRDGRANVCVATDVAARGIDLPNLDLVVHAELPGSHETLLHRSGRTGRAGRKGVSALVVAKRSRKKAERILAQAKLKAEWGAAPSAAEVHAQIETRLLSDPAWHAAVETSEEGLAETLQNTFSPAQLAAAYVRLYRSVRSAPEELADPGAKPAPRAEFGDSVWFSLSLGRDDGAEPRRILPMILSNTDLDKDAIGAIRVSGDESFVQIAADKAETVTAALGPKMELEPGAVLTKLAKPPALARESHKSNPRKPWAAKAERHIGKRDAGQREKRPRDMGTAKRGHSKPDRPSTPPIDWNDAPTPKPKRPKPADRKDRGRPSRDGTSTRSDKGRGNGPGKQAGTREGQRPGKPKVRDTNGKPERAKAADSAAKGKSTGPRGGGNSPAFKPKAPRNAADASASLRRKPKGGGPGKPRANRAQSGKSKPPKR